MEAHSSISLNQSNQLGMQLSSTIGRQREQASLLAQHAADFGHREGSVEKQTG